MRRLLILAWVACIAAGTLEPFDFAAEAAQSRGLFQYGAFQRQTSDVALNVLMFLPLGVLLHREGRSRGIARGRLFVTAGACALVLSTGIEYCQAFLPSRDSSLVDVLANGAGACAGVALSFLSEIRREACG